MERSPIISFKSLGIELCNAKTWRKYERPIFDKLYYEAIPIFYKDSVFRKIYVYKINRKNMKYYSMEEVQELYINYIIEHKIKPTGAVKGVIARDNRATKRND